MANTWDCEDYGSYKTGWRNEIAKRDELAADAESLSVEPSPPRLKGGADSRANSPDYWDPERNYRGPMSALGTPEESHWGFGGKKDRLEDDVSRAERDASVMKTVGVGIVAGIPIALMLYYTIQYFLK